MRTAQDIALILHFIGLAALLGGFLAQLTAPVKQVTRSMLDGAWTMLVSAFALVVTISAQGEEELDPAKYGIKGLVLAALILLLLQGRGKESIEKPGYFAIGLLTLTNVCIAVLWH